MICKAFRFDDMHGVAVIGFANPLPLKDLTVFLPPRAPPRGNKNTNRSLFFAPPLKGKNESFFVCVFGVFCYM